MTLMVSLWCQQGRGSGFPSRRRPRGSCVTGRGGRGRARMKNGVPPILTPGVRHIIWQLLYGWFWYVDKLLYCSSVYLYGLFASLQMNIMEPICTFKEEEENAMHSTVVIFSSTDTFTMKQVNVSERSCCCSCTCGVCCSLTLVCVCVCVFFRICVWFVGVLDRVWRVDSWPVLSVDSVTTPSVLT